MDGAGADDDEEESMEQIQVQQLKIAKERKCEKGKSEFSDMSPSW
jgi:hypothetical protein